MEQDVLIIGGGLAGLTAAIHLRKQGWSVRVCEKKQYPQHKVCGEYISAEIEPYFQSLGIDLNQVQDQRVNRFRLHAPSGRFIESSLPLGGLGIRRYTLDNFLFEIAKNLGVEFSLRTTIDQVVHQGDLFRISTKKKDTFQAKVVLGAFGKRSNLDKNLDRDFIKQPARYVGVKFYIEGDFPADLVSLYNFQGGYAGAVQVENGSVDIAYLCGNRQLQASGGITSLEENVLFKNPAIKALFKSGKRSPAKPIAISNVSFLPKKQVINGMLMIGDAAGMIPPLAGNGMAMGIHAAKIAAEKSHLFLQKKYSRATLEIEYQKTWRKYFSHRLYWGRRLHLFMGKKSLSEWSVRTLNLFPALLPPIIKQTHGAPISI